MRASGLATGEIGGPRHELAFKGRHFAPDVILLCMRGYCRYALNHRDLEEMMAERHLRVDHTTIYRWVQHYAPEPERRVQWCKLLQTSTWYVDETYVKIRGEWMYLYRAIGDSGETLDFHLTGVWIFLRLNRSELDWILVNGFEAG